MAKSTGARTTPLSSTTPAQASEAKLEGFAEDLGHLLGQARNKADSWLSQRNAIAKHLEEVRDTATRLLGQLGISGSGFGGSPAVVKRGPGRPPQATAANRPAGRKRRTMSAEAREKIAAAQRARWAKQKAWKK